MREQTHETIQQHQLLLPDSTLLVGVSGGADSLALLHILHTLRGALGVQLHVATLDHGLRGQAGADDARFVVETCEAWEIPVTAGAVVVESQGAGIEGAARRARYDFLAEVAHETGTQRVAVAHHADDQAETVLMHLIRGAGLRGLSGMAFSAPLPGHPDLVLIRPMLRATRTEIEVYCQQHKLQPRHDMTNQDTRRLRNRIRLETLPHLRQLNPQIDRALVQLARLAATDHAFLQQMLDSKVADGLTIESGRVTLRRDTFLDLSPALRQHFLLEALRQLGATDTGFEHIIQAVGLASRGRTGQIALLGGNLRLRIDYDAIVVERADTPPAHDGPLLPEDVVLDIAIPGDTPLPNGVWQLRTSHDPFPPEIPQVRLMIAGQPIVQLRTRRAGDRFAPPGLGGHTQKVKKWMIDHKLPQAIRTQIPILTLDGQIAAMMIGTRWVIAEPLAALGSQQAMIYVAFMQRELP